MDWDQYVRQRRATIESWQRWQPRQLRNGSIAEITSAILWVCLGFVLAACLMVW